MSLNSAQEAAKQVKQVLAQSPREYGWSKSRWTIELIQEALNWLGQVIKGGAWQILKANITADTRGSGGRPPNSWLLRLRGRHEANASGTLLKQGISRHDIEVMLCSFGQIGQPLFNDLGLRLAYIKLHPAPPIV